MSKDLRDWAKIWGTHWVKTVGYIEGIDATLETQISKGPDSIKSYEGANEQRARLGPRLWAGGRGDVIAPGALPVPLAIPGRKAPCGSWATSAERPRGRPRTPSAPRRRPRWRRRWPAARRPSAPPRRPAPTREASPRGNPWATTPAASTSCWPGSGARRRSPAAAVALPRPWAGSWGAGGRSSPAGRGQSSAGRSRGDDGRTRSFAGRDCAAGKRRRLFEGRDLRKWALWRRNSGAGGCKRASWGRSSGAGGWKRRAPGAILGTAGRSRRGRPRASSQEAFGRFFFWVGWTFWCRCSFSFLWKKNSKNYNTKHGTFTQNIMPTRIIQLQNLYENYNKFSTRLEIWKKRSFKYTE